MRARAHACVDAHTHTHTHNLGQEYPSESVDLKIIADLCYF